MLYAVLIGDYSYLTNTISLITSSVTIDSTSRNY
jgi:hypothetical protein